MILPVFASQGWTEPGVQILTGPNKCACLPNDFILASILQRLLLGEHWNVKLIGYFPVRKCYHGSNDLGHVSFSILMKLTSGEDGGTSPKAATVFSVLHSLRWGREASRLWLWIRRGEEASSVASSSGCWLVRVPHLCLDQPLSLFSMQPVLFPPEVPTSGHFRLASYYPLPLHKSIFPQGRRTGFIPSLGIE